jgi:hypothetical protein
VHSARLRPARWELVWRPAIWEDLERRGAAVAVVPFAGRAGRGGETGLIRLSRVENDKLVDVELWTSRDELGHALEAPVCERFGSFAGQPAITGEVTWTADDRRVVITGTRAGKPFEEIAR